MIGFTNSAAWLLIAEAAAKAPAKEAPAAQSGSLMDMLPALIGMLALFYFLILRPQRNKDQEFRTLVDNLKELDRVVTIGGIHGIVINVQRETGVVTLRVDESTGSKIRVNTSAIARVVTDEEKAG